MGGASSEEEVPLFLSNMFCDRHILRIPFTPLRILIAKMIVLGRAAKSIACYRQIGGSPLLRHTKKLAKKLHLKTRLPVFIAMRYTPPFSSEAIRQIEEIGAQRLIVIPLYPQYSTTTTLSSLEEFAAEIKSAGIEVESRAVTRFFDHPTYNVSVIERLKVALGKRDPSAYALIFSAHALPQSIVNRGDPYQEECEKHSEILRKYLVCENLEFASYHLAYQSKIGVMKWLTPSLDQTLASLAKEGVKRAVIVPISFAIDNLETDYELSIDYAARARKLGYEELLISSCPNDSDRFVQTLSELAGAYMRERGESA
jgi:ferrochelatase